MLSRQNVKNYEGRGDYNIHTRTSWYRYYYIHRPVIFLEKNVYIVVGIPPRGRPSLLRYPVITIRL